jgi:transposase
MSAAPTLMQTAPPMIERQPLAPFATEYVTLTKQAHIELVMQAKSWKSLHSRATQRERVQKLRHCQQLQALKVQAAKREAALRAELVLAIAKIRELQKRVFGRKSERSKGGSEVQAPASETKVPRRPRGHQKGTRSRGRSMQPELPQRVEVVELESPKCPSCGLGFSEFPGTEDSEVLEIEVKAYRRVIRRLRYKTTCNCGCMPGIVTAPPVPRLIDRGKFGVSVWTTVLLDKFLYGRPSHRLIQDLADHGLEMSPGTLAGGLKAIAPLFKPLDQLLLAKLRSEAHWHADETRWAVFAATEGKVGHRWYLWVFHSPSVVHYVLDPSRATTVIEGELKGVTKGIINCDRYSAYKKFARLYPGILLAFCWAHQRRDYLELGNAHPSLLSWAMDWVDLIGQLYHLNGLRCGADEGSEERRQHQEQLQLAIKKMASKLDAALIDPLVPKPAIKVLKSMKNHWPGLTVFVDHPWVPMDNNKAERAVRLPVVGRKNFYGSGAQWSGELAASMYSVLMTVVLWGLNARTWLSAYLQACADNNNQAPQDMSPFLPWAMDEARLRAMCRGPLEQSLPKEGIDSS